MLPRIPSLHQVERHFQAARDASFFSNFGPVSFAFEADLQQAFFPGDHVVACSSCTSGLSAALLALQVDGPVLIPAFTFPATASAVLGAGLRAVVGDVDPGSGVLDPAWVGPAVREQGVRAVMAVRPYGLWSDLSDLGEACQRHGVPLLIDNAAGLGVDIAQVGRFRLPGVIEVFSLHATKPFAVGEGGVIVCPPEREDDLRSALNFGLWAAGTLPRGGGINGKMGELTAAMARTVLEDLPARIAQRQGMAACMNAAAVRDGLETICAPGQEAAAPWQCLPVRLPPARDVAAVVDACAGFGLQLRRYYHPLVTDGDGAGRFPAAQNLSDRAVCLPIYDGAEAGLAEEMWDGFRQALG